ncbi:discoidin domain-containing protein [Nocardia yamanashiensis]|uniref:discoidin domain-containing protein n=1 Tax=Nocardia yamanashiensis TaxID=209247 RepID=UPI00082EC85C|nr:discoidin domain-containing protein [Nocardia yamanashiensis]
MSDEETGDVFLRHRDAVLDALLSDPELSEPGIPGFDPGILGEFESPDPLPDPVSVARERDAGPKASDRILALLSGETPTETPDFGFAAHLPEDRDSAPESAPAEQPRHTRRARGGFNGAELLMRLRNPKVALALGATLALLLIMVFVLSGGSDPPASTVYATVTSANPTAATTAGAPVTTTAAAAAIQVRSAQSHCPPGGTPAMDAFAGPGKAWSCARAYRADGQVLTIDLGRSYQVESIGLVPGWDSVAADGTDQWPKYRTASRVSYHFDDGTTYTQRTLDQRTLVTTKFSPAVTASKIVLTVLESQGATGVNVTALSSIVITGH